MQRLRHPIRSIREPFGKAGLIVAVIALVFAMVGGAFAAAGLNGKQKKEVKTIAKGLVGTGPAGAAGTNGTNGTNGKDGAAGSNGTNGTNGNTVLNGSATPTTQGVDGDFYIKTGASPEIFGPKAGGAWGAGTALKGPIGTPGTNGNTVLNGTTAPGAGTGANGDFYINTVTIEIFGPKTAGAWGSGTSLKGTTGFTETLPTGKTETGSFAAVTNASGKAFVPISFSIPLGVPQSIAKVKINKIPGAANVGSGTLNETTLVTGTVSPGFEPGSKVSGVGIPVGATVAKKISNTEFELSVAATASGPTTITAEPNVPNIAECEDPAHPGSASPTNPEAKPTFLCIYFARNGLLPASGGTGLLAGATASFTLQTGNSGGQVGTNTGYSTTGASMAITGGGSEQEVVGTFAVTAP